MTYYIIYQTDADLVCQRLALLPEMVAVGQCAHISEAVLLLQNQTADFVFVAQVALDAATAPQRELLLQAVAQQNALLMVYNNDELPTLIQTINAVKPVIKPEIAPPPYFFVNADYSLLKVNIADITHVESMKDYLKIYVGDTFKQVITRMNMKTMEEKLLPHRFVRVHRSYIVSVDKIESVRNARITIGSYLIPVGDNYKDDFMQLLENI